jgi:hypothetical protein
MPKPVRRSIAVPVVIAALAAGCANGSDSASTGVRGENRNLIATSANHTCALRSAGLFCWGDNVAGELGNGSTQPSATPVRASVAGNGIVEIATSSGRTCVRRSTGEMGCWGMNDQGQIGDGTRVDALSPVPVSGVQDAIAMAIDDVSSCALRSDQRVACWGLSPEHAPESGSLLPVTLEGLSEIVEIRNGMMGSYCARSADGGIWCWRVTDGAWTEPSEVSELSGARTMALAAWNEVCAVSSAGNIVCHNLDSHVTIPLTGSEDSVTVRGAGGLAACGMSTSGRWRCWNVLPPMLETVGSTPVEVRSEVPIEELVIGGFRVCSLRADDSVACANANDIGLMPLPENAELAVVEGLPP